MRLIGQYALKTASYEIQWFHIGAQHHSNPSCTLPLSIRLVSSFTSTVSFIWFDAVTVFPIDRQWNCGRTGGAAYICLLKIFKRMPSVLSDDLRFSFHSRRIERGEGLLLMKRRTSAPTGRCTYRPTWKRRGRSTISTFTGGTLYQRTSHVWLSLDMRGRAMGDCPLVDRSQMAFLWTYKILYFTITKMLKWIKWITKYICCPPK